MDLLNNKDTEKLLNAKNDIFVSLYMPTFHSGRKVTQNPIRLKNLFSCTEEKLLACGIDEKQISNILRPAEKLYKTSVFWQYQKNGLALFLSWGYFQYFRLPISVEEISVVSENCFHLMPLLELQNVNQKFYLLAFSQNKIRFFKASHFDIRQIKLGDAPKNFQQALNLDEQKREIQVKTQPRGQRGGRTAMFHGHGGEDDSIELLAQYCRIIDKAIHQKIKGKTFPLILACDDKLFPIYRDANTYPYLVKEVWVSGNPDKLKPEQLNESAYNKLKSQFMLPQKKALEQYNQLMNTDRTSDKIEEILPAAFYGKVAQLFIAQDSHLWGKYDKDAEKIDIHSKAQHCDEDLLNLCAIQTHNHGGEIFVLNPDKMPNNSSIAALFRY
ncbi:hypothetical protein DRQ33_01500 [bacterium]|nr:MAG: hypothetical protein DRQ33_01500 [bacterium]